MQTKLLKAKEAIKLTGMSKYLIDQYIPDAKVKYGNRCFYRRDVLMSYGAEKQISEDERPKTDTSNQIESNNQIDWVIPRNEESRRGMRKADITFTTVHNRSTKGDIYTLIIRGQAAIKLPGEHIKVGVYEDKMFIVNAPEGYKAEQKHDSPTKRIRLSSTLRHPGLKDFVGDHSLKYSERDGMYYISRTEIKEASNGKL